MSLTDTRIARDYAEAVFRRGREPLPPLNFEPDWADQPSRHKVYREVARIPLARSAGVRLGPLRDSPANPGHADWDLGGLSVLLGLSYGVLDRRLRVNWNHDVHDRMHYPTTNWGRGTASGGGMYPLEVYLVTAGRDGLLPGVYHYSTAHHALDRLATGNAVDRVRAALLDHPGGAADYLLVSVRFWKNSFKYNSFCYHVVTQDLGALLGSWEFVAAGLDWPWQRVLWFADPALDAVLGLDTDDESVLAVVPLPRTAPPAAGGGAALTAAGSLADTAPRPPRRPSFERSRTVLRFAQVERVHRAAVVRAEPRPPVPRFDPDERAGALIPLPARTCDLRMDTDLADLLHKRHSSFGTFARAALPLSDVATVLARMASAARYRSDVTDVDSPALTGLHLVANRIDALPPGAYHYRAADHGLERVVAQPVGRFLQGSYFLRNYNLEEVGAVLAISARLDPMLAHYGNRGLRLINSEVGAVAQAAYLTATALGIGCGAVLGFDNVGMNELIGLAGTDRQTFLFLLLGSEPAQSANVELPLV
ncbi:SagB family peptide dehydrogenase [Actinokineospora sp.]|uniref:SagB family peptide dehydrogenase n=1 Tax=Actinokineospora sp. TaxID=1872133 RepID=UPI0040384C9A